MRVKLTIALLLISALGFAQTMSINWLRQSTYTASGTNTYTVSATGVTQYVAGLELKILFTNANTGASTINVNSLGARTLQKNGAAVGSGDIAAGGTYRITYDGTNFQVLGIGGSGGGGGVTAGDKGDITVTLGPENWTIDNNAVTNAKINDVGWSKITGTPTSLSGYGVTGAETLSSLRLNGTNGAGFLQLDWQSSNPAGAASRTTMWADATGRLNWRLGTGGSSFIRTFNATGITANRTYTLPDFSGTLLAIGTNALGGNSLNLLNGNVLVGPTGASITANTRFDVRGLGTTGGTFAFRIANASNVGLLTFSDLGIMDFSPATGSPGISFSGQVSIGSTSNGSVYIPNGGGLLLSGLVTTGSNNILSIINGTSLTATTGIQRGQNISVQFAPTSGTATFTALGIGSVLNTTGTYSGTVYGIDYNSTNTSLTGATHIASRWTSGSHIIGGTTLTNANTIFDIQSTTQGFAFPRMTTTQRDAIASPYSGLFIYNNSSNALNFHNGTAWQSVLGSQTSSSDLGSANFQIQSSSVKRRTETFYAASVDGTSWNGAFTQTNILNTVPNNSVIVIRATFIGLQTSGTPGSSGFHYVIERAFRRNATTTSAIAPTTTIVSSNDTGDTFTLLPTLTTSGSNINFERTLSTTKTFLVSLKLEVSIIEQ